MGLSECSGDCSVRFAGRVMDYDWIWHATQEWTQLRGAPYGNWNSQQPLEGESHHTVNNE